MTTIHLTKTIQSVQPRYVGRFSCTGAACEDSCCSGWTVQIDKKTFTAYRQAKQPLLMERMASQVKRIRSLASDAKYARIEMQPETQDCPFLEEKLCSVQRELGEDKLSDTCATYPRKSRVLGGQHQQALTLSCPEAARLALLAPDAMDFVEVSGKVRVESVIQIRNKQGLSPEMMESVSLFCLKLMKVSSLSLWQKLAALGVFIELLTASLKRGGHAGVPALLNDFDTMVSTGGIADALSAMMPDYAVQATAFSGLWQIKKGRKNSAVQRSVQAMVAKGLGADPITNLVTQQQLIDNYRSGVQRLPEALKPAPYLLENFLLNEMFSEGFPFAEASPYDHFLKLVTQFGLLRFMLAAQCNDAAQLPDVDQMARTVQVFSRKYQHDADFAKRVNGALKNSGWDALEKVYRFLRT
ncbi:flagellin lysine-N-methylase [Limnohabitans sp.]|uniref:flagellin lysine-N-methylase n=1 Tax=Limnohabitans sp. TaxID=1907725 RepID=UPI0025C19853|nr:flagellin lysine-N-methylase [Limnohabitans sp.]